MGLDQYLWRIKKRPDDEIKVLMKLLQDDVVMIGGGKLAHCTNAYFVPAWLDKYTEYDKDSCPYHLIYPNVLKMIYADANEILRNPKRLSETFSGEWNDDDIDKITRVSNDLGFIFQRYPIREDDVFMYYESW